MTRAPEPGVFVAQLLKSATRAIPAPGAEPGTSRGDAAGARLRIVAIGWATVELDRAAVQFATELGLPGDSWAPAARDSLLGAAVLLGPVLGPDPDGPRLILLEPDTEGRLAAALARRGEGVAVVYVVRPPPTTPGRRVSGDAPGLPPGGPAYSAAAPGPLGQARLVPGGPTWGPHVVVLDAPPNPESLPSADD